MSPIFWFLDEANEILNFLFQINPVGQIIELAHKLVVFGTIPPLLDWLYTTSFVVAIFLVGYAVFQKFQNKIIEEL